MSRYSAFKIFREGLRGQKGWGKAWRTPTLKPEYDVIIIGGGGHGLAWEAAIRVVTPQQSVRITSTLKALRYMIFRSSCTKAYQKS